MTPHGLTVDIHVRDMPIGKALAAVADAAAKVDDLHGWQDLPEFTELRAALAALRAVLKTP